MFVGRAKELELLDKLYAREQHELVILYGRRRIGKTTLIKKFCYNKEHIFFLAQEHNDALNLINFSNELMKFFDAPLGSTPFADWLSAFRYLASAVKDRQIVMVLDEFPYIARANKTIASALQHAVDHYFSDTKIFLIIAGSSMSFIEKEVLSYNSPLYGRRTALIRLEELNYLESAEFFPDYSNADKMSVFGVVGGVPHYLRMFDRNIKFANNICEHLFSNGAYLSSEPELLLRQELREPAVYISIIEAIAQGASKLNEIVTKSSVERLKCSKYLDNLIELGIVQREVPFGEKRQSKKGIYRLRDNLFRFWYRFFPKVAPYIEQELTEYAWINIVEPEIPAYLGGVFEDVCIQYLKILNRAFALPIVFADISRWWGTDNINKMQVEIDIVASCNDELLVCECKWLNSAVSDDVIEALRDKARCFKGKVIRYYIFSKSGYTQKAVVCAAKYGDVSLITAAEVYFAKTAPLLRA